jgi:hypothetical protein
MTFREFCKYVRDNDLTIAQIRCDVPLTPAVHRLLEECDTEARYESLVLQYERMMLATLRKGG